MRFRFSVAILCLVLLLSGCSTLQQNNLPPTTLPPQEPPSDNGYVVKGIMQYPNYPLREIATPRRLRLRAVTAFKDLLSVRWSVAESISYNKTGPVSEKNFHHDKDVTYAGTIYSNANTGLFQFLEFYDFETGRIWYPGDADEFKEALGASCADAMIWGVTTVCNSLTGPYYPVYMVYKYGYLPVGDYTYDYTIENYNHLPTYKIVQENGTDVIVDAYTKVQAGDMFVSTPDNHAMMAIHDPVIYYNKDGSINLEKSYIMIQDQRGGSGAGFYLVWEDGQTLRYSGRTSARFLFKDLLKKSYIPVTTAEFMGIKEYEKCTATATVSQCSTLDELRSVTVESNFPLAVVNMIAADQFGNEAVIDRQLFNGAHIDGVPRSFELKELPVLKDFESSPYNRSSYTIKIEVVPSTGERFIVTQLAL